MWTSGLASLYRKKLPRALGRVGGWKIPLANSSSTKTLDLFRSLSLSASQRPSGSRKECGCALRVHALRVLADRQRILDDGCETFWLSRTLTYLDFPRT